MFGMEAATARKMHLFLMLFWGINLILVWFLPSSWRIPYLIFVSIYANFVGHWSAYSAERPVELETDTNGD
jgi:hypothetical protein